MTVPKRELARQIAPTFGLSMAGAENYTGALTACGAVPAGGLDPAGVAAVIFGISSGGTAVAGDFVAAIAAMRPIRFDAIEDPQPGLCAPDGSPLATVGRLLSSGGAEVRALGVEVHVISNPVEVRIALGAGEARRTWMYAGQRDRTSAAAVRRAVIVPPDALADIAELVAERCRPQVFEPAVELQRVEDGALTP